MGGPTISMTISTNACWAIGEVCQKAPPQTLTPFLDALVPALLAILQRRDVKPWQSKGHHELLHTVCMTMNYLRRGTALGQQWPTVCAQLPADLQETLRQRYGLSA